jgi:hypothetical protein
MVSKSVIDGRMLRPYCNECAYSKLYKWVGDYLHPRKKEILCEERDCPSWPYYSLYRGVGRRVVGAVKRLGKKAKLGLKSIRKYRNP